MKCQVIDCENKAEYYDEFNGHCGDMRRVRVVVCREHYLYGWVINSDNREEGEREILGDAERIEE